MEDLQELIGKLTRKWAKAGQWVVPDQRDCLEYTAAKAIADRLRLQMNAVDKVMNRLRKMDRERA